MIYPREELSGEINSSSNRVQPAPFAELEDNSSARAIRKAVLTHLSAASQLLCSLDGALLIHLLKHKNERAHFVMFGKCMAELKK